MVFPSPLGSIGKMAKTESVRPSTDAIHRNFQRMLSLTVRLQWFDVVTYLLVFAYTKL